MVAATLDLVLVHPVMEIPNAWDDTREILWDDMEWQDKYATESAFLPFRTVFTPIWFTGDMVARSSFDISRSGGNPRRLEEGRRKAADASSLTLEAEKELAAGHGDMALAKAEAALKIDPERNDALKVKVAALLDKGDIATLRSMTTLRRVITSEPVISRMVAAFNKEGERPRKMALLSLLNMTWYDWADASQLRAGRLVESIAPLLQDEDRALRLKALQTLKNFSSVKGVKAMVKGVANGSDPVLAEEAATIIARDWQ
jgi:hypothetical protein